MLPPRTEPKCLAATVIAAMTLSATVPIQPAVAQPASPSSAPSAPIARASQVTQFYRTEYTFVYRYSTATNRLDVPISGSWTYAVTQGGELATVTKEAGKLVVTPQPGAKGDVVVVVTDSLGSTYKYTVSVDNTVPAVQNPGPTTFHLNYIWRFVGSNGAGVIQLPEGGRWKVVSGGEYIDARADGQKLIITPKPNANGHNVVIEATDKDGNTYRYEITINIQTNDVTFIKRIEPGQEVIIDEVSTWTMLYGNELINVRETNGKLIVQAKGGVNGEAEISVKDPRGDEKRYTFDVADTAPVIEERSFNLYDGGEYGFSVQTDYTARVVSGEQFVSVSRTGEELVVRGGVEPGSALMEIRDSKGRLVARYTFNVVTSLKTAKTRVVNQQITDRGELHVAKGSEANTLSIESGKDLVEVVAGPNGDLTLYPKQGANGTVVVLEKDAKGNVVTRYNVVVTPAPVDETTRSITSDQTVTIAGPNLVLVRGGELVDIKKNGGDWTLVPKPGANGTVVVEGRDERGRTRVRYTVNISPAPAPSAAAAPRLTHVTVEHLVELTDKYTLQIGDGHTIWIDRPDLVVIDGDGRGGYVIKPAPGASGTVIIEERDGAGSAINRWVITITQPAAGQVPAPEQGTIEVVGQDGGLAVKVPGSGGRLEIVGGGDEYIIRDNGDGTWTITRKDGKPVTGTLHLTWSDAGGRTVAANVTITNTQTTQNTNIVLEPGRASSESKCTGAIVAVAAPLLLLIPLGILTQVRIPGLEALQAQISDAIRDTNAHIQEGLGIYDEERAKRAASINDALAVVNPQTIGLAAGSLALIAAGLIVGDAVLRACGQEEATITHAVQNAKADAKANASAGAQADAKGNAPAAEKPRRESRLRPTRAAGASAGKNN